MNTIKMNTINPLYHETIHNNSDNGWGFYIDIESLTPVLMDDNYNSHQKYDDYDNNIYNKYSNYIHDTTDNIKNSPQLNAFIVRASSTTIITAAITYFVFFIL
jgi:hypothetical protein